jgi:hypothetical protein
VDLIARSSSIDGSTDRRIDRHPAVGQVTVARNDEDVACSTPVRGFGAGGAFAMHRPRVRQAVVTLTASSTCWELGE